MRTITSKEIARREELKEIIRNNVNFPPLRAVIQSSISAAIEERPTYESAARTLLGAILKDAKATQKEFEDILDVIKIEVVESGLSTEDEQGVKAFQEFMEAAFQDPEFWDVPLKKETKRIEDEMIVGVIAEKDAREKLKRIVEQAMDNTITQGTTVLFSVPENMSATNISFQEPAKKEYVQTTPKLTRKEDIEKETFSIEVIGKTREKAEIFPELKEHEIESGEKLLEVKIPPDARFIRRDTEGMIKKRLNTAKQKAKYDEIAKERTEKLLDEMTQRLFENRRLISEDQKSQEVLEKLREVLKEKVSEEEYEKISREFSETIKKASIKDLQKTLKERREKEWGA
jgi:hypothetical protein